MDERLTTNQDVKLRMISLIYFPLLSRIQFLCLGKAVVNNVCFTKIFSNFITHLQKKCEIKHNYYYIIVYYDWQSCTDPV